MYESSLTKRLYREKKTNTEKKDSDIVDPRKTVRKKIESEKIE